MKMRALAYAMVVGCALGSSSASAENEALTQNSVTSVSSFVQSWQQRILNENLPVADPQNWALRSMPKFASFSADRLALAMRTHDIGELESLLTSAPIANGTSLGMLMATKPGNIALDGMVSAASRGPVQKTDPGLSPTSYADLVFTAVNPCRIFDSRVSQGGLGPMVNGVPRSIKIGPYSSAGGGYATGSGAQGGSATGCGLDTLATTSDIAAVMVATSSFAQTGTGYLTFYSDSAADPSATVVSMFYTVGPVQTAFVVMPTDLIPPVYSRGISRNANTELTVDVVGYFARPKAAALDCINTAPVTVSVAAGADGQAIASACAAGYTQVALTCETGAFNTPISGIGPTFSCVNHNNNGGPVNLTAVNRCCRVPGR